MIESTDLLEETSMLQDAGTAAVLGAVSLLLGKDVILLMMSSDRSKIRAFNEFLKHYDQCKALKPKILKSMLPKKLISAIQ